ncbi:MAG TPA: VOC family protein [Caulobacterales bacterium]|jgi:uncharacterized glyoxalase superfamily protein PhnB|nr:VOC family protein [Caulobacterales bacterium]
MQASRLTPLLNVSNCSASIAFYAELGFKTETTWENAGVLRFAQLRCGDIQLMLNQPSGHDLAPRNADPYGGQILFFNVPSVHALYDELRAKGLSPREPTSESYGVDEMHLADPDGYWLAFSSPLNLARSSAAG